MTPTAAQQDLRRAHDLRRMKRFATGLFVLAAVVFAVAHVLEPHHGWAGYVRAFAEASMVGAIADWFAVTALFRHPLGLPIPHTAIIPNRKDDIGRGLGSFVENNFLTPEVVEEKLRATSVAARLGTWLAMPENACKVGEQVGTVTRSLLATLRDADVQEAIERSISGRVRTTPAGPVLSRVLDLAVADGRHQQVLSAVLRRVVDVLGENRSILRSRLDQESPWWVPDPLDDRLFSKIFDGVTRFLSDVAADPNHELRVSFDDWIGELVEALASSPDMQQRAEDLKVELLEHPALRSWSVTVWADLKESLLRRTADPDSELRQRLEALLIEFGERLKDDDVLRAKVDDWIVGVAVHLVEQSRGEVGEFIATTVERWDPAESTERIELQVGRDLQFIRINGTVVGGLAGLVIYSVSRLL